MTWTQPADVVDAWIGEEFRQLLERARNTRGGLDALGGSQQATACAQRAAQGVALVIQGLQPPAEKKWRPPLCRCTSNDLEPMGSGGRAVRSHQAFRSRRTCTPTGAWPSRGRYRNKAIC